MKKKIVVFLGDKLISIDTILPIILAVKNHNESITIKFYTLQSEALKEIKKNLVLYEAINKIGTIWNLGLIADNNANKYLLKVLRLLHIITIFSSSIFCNIKVIHFGFFENSYLKIFYNLKFINFYFFEKNCWGYNQIMRKFQILKRDRKENNLVSNNNFLVSFSENWPKVKKNNKLKNLIITPSRLWPDWQNFIKIVENNFWNKELKNKKIDTNKINILFVLGYLGELDFYSSNKSSLLLLENTLKLLSHFENSINVILKPHAITDLELVKKIIKKNNYKNFFISYLHVGLIAKFCKVSIANYYSLALIDAFFSKSITIEYTDYSNKALKVSGNKSVIDEYVSYFLNFDKKRLENILIKLVNDDLSAPYQNINFKYSKNDLALISMLSN